MPNSQWSDQKAHATPLRRAPSADAPAAAQAADAHPLLTLQRQLGNAQIARMLAQREGVPEEEEELLQAKHDPSVAQREGSPEEEEELLQAKHDAAIAQREEVPNEEEDEDMLMQATPEVGLEGGPVSDAVSGQIESKRGGGSALDSSTQAEMEGAMGANFADVRVHNDTESHQLNQQISAKAFTTGSDIFLGPSASASDHSLMAHELTHVVQQRGMTTSGPMTVGAAGDSYEQQADATAATVTSGGTVMGAQRESEE